MPPVAKNLFEKRFLDLQKLLINKKFLPRFFQKAGRRRHNSLKDIACHNLNCLVICVNYAGSGTVITYL